VPVRRGVLVTAVESEWIIQRGAADLTSASLRGVNLTDRSLQRTISEGHARRARRSGMDNQTWCTGRDKRVPPRREPDKRVPPRTKSEANRLGYPFLITMNRSNHRQASDPPDSRQLPGPGQRRSMAFRIERVNDPVPESSP